MMGKVRRGAQDVLAEFDLPRAVLATIENVNPSECIASLGALVKVLSPDRSKNEFFAQQYIAVRFVSCGSAHIGQTAGRGCRWSARLRVGQGCTTMTRVLCVCRAAA